MRSLAILCVLLVGCGKADYRAPMTMDAATSPAPEAIPASESTATEAAKTASRSDAAADAIERKIIYTSRLDLVVEDFTPVEPQIEELVGQFKGYVSNAEVSGAPGTPRRGTWTVRVPADRYEEFVQAARKLGELVSATEDARDVTDEFYDVEARIRHKRVEEERLVALLQEATGKLDEVLKVEKELARVRGEIEQVEGRMRVLSHLIALSTVHLSVQEVRDYVPEQQVTLGTRLSRGLSTSWGNLLQFAANLLVGLVIAAPWLLALALVVVPPILLIRVLIRRKKP